MEEDQILREAMNKEINVIVQPKKMQILEFTTSVYKAIITHKDTEC